VTRSILKQALTAQILEKITEYDELADKTSFYDIWINPQKHRGFRLTNTGYFIFRDIIKVSGFEFKLKNTKIDTRMLFALDKHLKMPYYIESDKKMPCKLILFGSDEAMMMSLYNDLHDFLESYRL
jgi:hypothetical protein